MFCENCGNQIPDDALFCGKCGNPVKVPEINEAEGGDAAEKTAHTIDMAPSAKPSRAPFIVLGSVV